MASRSTVTGDQEVRKGRKSGQRELGLRGRKEQEGRRRGKKGDPDAGGAEPDPRDSRLSCPLDPVEMQRLQQLELAELVVSDLLSCWLDAAADYWRERYLDRCSGPYAWMWFRDNLLQLLSTAGQQPPDAGDTYSDDAWRPDLQLAPPAVPAWTAAPIADISAGQLQERHRRQKDGDGRPCLEETTGRTSAYNTHTLTDDAGQGMSRAGQDNTRRDNTQLLTADHSALGFIDDFVFWPTSAPLTTETTEPAEPAATHRVSVPEAGQNRDPSEQFIQQEQQQQLDIHAQQVVSCSFVPQHGYY